MGLGDMVYKKYYNIFNLYCNVYFYIFDYTAALNYQLSETRKRRPNVQHSAQNIHLLRLLAFIANCKYMTLPLQNNCIKETKKKTLW